MKAGKKLHGENWSASNGEQPSLRCAGNAFGDLYLLGMSRMTD